MARNIEIKARVSDNDFKDVRTRASTLCHATPEVLQQKDTFFKIPRGRLKLREFANGSGELIFYERPDELGPKPSSYFRSPCESPQTLLPVLTRALGVRGVVVKRREVFLFEQTRIHLDKVSSLGRFLELEVVLGETQSDSEGEAKAKQVLEKLGVRLDHLVSTAYIDLLEADATNLGHQYP